MTQADTTQAEVTARLLSFIRDRFLGNDPASRLDGETPLLDWGILNSMNTAELVTFIRTEFGYSVPQDGVNVKNFRTADRIAAMIVNRVD
ncbi:acyl carrier protein [Nocardia sp. IFM 10818]